MSELELVTGFWPPEVLGRQSYPRQTVHYLELFQRLHKLLPFPLTIHIEPYLVPSFEPLLIDTEHKASRRIVPIRFDSIRRVDPRYEKLTTPRNVEVAKGTREFSMMSWAKVNLLLRRAEEVPEASHVGWIDFGLLHVADINGFDWRELGAWQGEGVRIGEMCSTSRMEYEQPDFYHFNRGKIMAGYFVCSQRGIREFHDECEKELEKMLARGDVYLLEEQLYAGVLVQKRKLFDLFYGDYEGVLKNFAGPVKRDASLLLYNLGHCLGKPDLQENGARIARKLAEAFENKTLSSLENWTVNITRRR